MIDYHLFLQIVEMNETVIDVVFHYVFESQTVSSCVLSCSMDTWFSLAQVLYKRKPTVSHLRVFDLGAFATSLCLTS